MRRVVESFRSLGALIAVAAMALLVLSSCSEAIGGAREEFTGYDEVEGLDQVVAKRWLSTPGNPEIVNIDWVQGFVATLFLFESDEQAADGFPVIESGARDIVAELLQIDPETETIESWEAADLELDGAQSASWRATLVSEDEPETGEIVVTLVRESSFLVMTVGLAAPVDAPVREGLVEWLGPTAVELSGGILTRPADDDPVSGSDDSWSGGVWGKFPSDEDELPIVARLTYEAEVVIYQSPDAIAMATAEAEAEATRSAIAHATASAEAEAARATATAEAIAAEATATAEARALIDNAPAGMIAYAADSNIWVMQPDGSGAQQISIEGQSRWSNETFSDPAWSHDGTMLAFTGPFPDSYDDGILVYSNGQLTPIPGTTGCHHPVFSPDNERVLYSCDPSKAYDHDDAGLVTSSNVDGTGQQLHLEFPVEETWSPTTDWRLVGLDVRPSDGAVLVAVLDERAPEFTVELYDAEFNLDTTVDVAGMFGPDALGPYSAQFMVDGEGIVGAMCLSSCTGYQDQLSPVRVTLDGGTTTYPVPESIYSSFVSEAPDGAYVVMGSASGRNEIMISDGSGRIQVIGEGAQPVWQPVPAEIVMP